MGALQQNVDPDVVNRLLALALGSGDEEVFDLVLKMLQHGLPAVDGYWRQTFNLKIRNKLILDASKLLSGSDNRKSAELARIARRIHLDSETRRLSRCENLLIRADSIKSLPEDPRQYRSILRPHV